MNVSCLWYLLIATHSVKKDVKIVNGTGMNLAGFSTTDGIVTQVELDAWKPTGQLDLQLP